MTYKLVISAIIASSLSALPAIAKTSVTKGNGTVRIANEHVAMEFADNGSFDIVSMKFAGTEMAKPGDNSQPWSLTYLGEQGETPTIEPRYAVYHGWREEDCDTSKAIVFSWHTRLKYDGNNYPVEMRVSLDDNADLLRCLPKTVRLCPPHRSGIRFARCSAGQLIQRNVEAFAERQQLIQLRRGCSAFPLRDRLSGNADGFRKLLLGKSRPSSEPIDRF